MSWTLRAATPADAEAVAGILTAFQTDTPWMPKLHSHAGNRKFCARIIDQGGVTVGVRDARIAGFLNVDGAEIDHLYLDPADHRQGLGRRLVDHAKIGAARLDLWCFQANTGARAFYERLGFEEQMRTDGATNEEKLPDIRYVWTRS